MNDGEQAVVDDLVQIMDESTSGKESSQQLDPIDEQCEHFIGGSEFNEPLRLRRIKERYPESYQELESELESVVGRYVGQIQRQKFEPFKKYISQVLLYRDREHRGRILRRLRNELIGYPGKLFIWTDEGDHLHLIHDCPYSNGTCRCRIFKGEDLRFPVRSPMRRLRNIQELDQIDWTNVILYFILSKWKSQSQIWIGGRLQRSADHDQVIRWRSVQTKSREILAREDEGVGYNSSSQEHNQQNSGVIVRESTQSAGEKRRQAAADQPVRRKRGKFERISETVSSLLKQTYCIPAHHIRDIFAHDPISDCLYDPSAQKFVDAACQLFTQRVNHFTMSMFRAVYEQCNPIFYANSKNPFDYYHTREESVEIVKELLEWQYGGDEERIKMFLTNVRDWFNKKGWEGNPKCNAITIIGPPNSGKNYFFDMLGAIAFNVGHIGRVNNKTNNFALQECYGKRMVIGNEISMEEGAMEDFKKLCEGTAFNIRVKFQGDKIFTKAPVLLISNSALQITNHPHFENVRNKTMRWSQAPLLAKSTMKPYPLCIFDIYNMYDISIE
uniref:Nonstructural protein 1 n=1 Tax=Scindoambidensovirus sp. TaxID=2809839 RepID=A0AB74ULK2_9VIRU